jgi:hypothetical protein
MENEERAHIESYYQNKLESVKNEVAHMTNLLEQLLKAKNGEGTSTQPIMGAPAAHIQGTSQNLGADSTTDNTLCLSLLSRQVKLPSLWI